MSKYEIVLSLLSILVDKNGGKITIENLSQYNSRMMTVSIELDTAQDKATIKRVTDSIVGPETDGTIVQ